MMNDEEIFWQAVHAMMAYPVTKNGHRPSDEKESYREGAFCTRVVLCVNAKDDRDMEVQLWTEKPQIAAKLDRAHRSAHLGALAPFPPGTNLVRRAGRDAPEKEYLELSWKRTGAFSSEIPMVEASVAWFHSVVRPLL